MVPHVVSIGDCVLPAVVRCTPLKGTNIYDAFRRTVLSTITYVGRETEEQRSELLNADTSAISYKSRRRGVEDHYVNNQHKRFRPDIRRKYRVTLM